MIHGASLPEARESSILKLIAPITYGFSSRCEGLALGFFTEARVYPFSKIFLLRTVLENRRVTESHGCHFRRPGPMAWMHHSRHSSPNALLSDPKS